MSYKEYDKAWKLLEATGWCQQEFARDKQSDIVDYRSEEACQFCILGAINRVYLDTKHHSILDNHLLQKGIHDVVEWNDNPMRTKEEVIELLKELDI
jgi:hypothetical protein